jgi:predicted RNA-binding Zn ribbon-like protein
VSDHQFELVAGVLCLDFVNTVGDRGGTWQYVRNYLQRYEDVVSWGLQAQVLAEREAAAMRALAFKRYEQSAAALARAVELRETLHTVFAPIAAGRPIRREALAALNALTAPLLAKSQLAIAPDGLACRWQFNANAPSAPPAMPPPDADAAAAAVGLFDRVAWSVARSATELLTSADLRHVHQCALETCGWLFLDVSKNKTRRWCAMKMCGNKAKVRHHRATRRQEAQGET